MNCSTTESVRCSIPEQMTQCVQQNLMRVSNNFISMLLKCITYYCFQICQWYPDMNASAILARFFMMFSTWKWPKAIYLCEMENNSMGLLQWDPMDSRDAQVCSRDFKLTNAVRGCSCSVLYANMLILCTIFPLNALSGRDAHPHAFLPCHELFV
jgi:hypothetical protein